MLFQSRAMGGGCILEMCGVYVDLTPGPPTLIYTPRSGLGLLTTRLSDVASLVQAFIWALAFSNGVHVTALLVLLTTSKGCHQAHLQSTGHFMARELVILLGDVLEFILIREHP